MGVGLPTAGIAARAETGCSTAGEPCATGVVLDFTTAGAFSANAVCTGARPVALATVSVSVDLSAVGTVTPT